MMILTPQRTMESAEEAPRYLAVQPQVEPHSNESLLQISHEQERKKHKKASKSHKRMIKNTATAFLMP